MTDPLTQLSLGDGGEPSAEFSSTLRTRIDAIEARANRARPRGWHLAQLNLGVFKAPLDSPEMAEFAAALDRINAIAEESPGFIWRLVDDDGGSSSYVDVPGATDPLLAPNLSVWTDLESLRGFMFRTDHATYLRRRTEWFQRHGEAMTVGWWIPAGEIPTLVDAMRRLHHLREHGPSDIGFPLSRRIPHPPSQPASTTPTETTMTQSPQTLIPYLAVSDARAALQFYAEVFGAEQSGESFEMDDGRIGHAEMTVNGATFYLAHEFPEMELYQPMAERKSPVAVVIHVDDCDAVYDHAVAAGATGERPPANQHGQRNGWFTDPWGHRWSPTSVERADRV